MQCTPIRSASSARDPERREQYVGLRKYTGKATQLIAKGLKCMTIVMSIPPTSNITQDLEAQQTKTFTSADLITRGKASAFYRKKGLGTRYHNLYCIFI